MYQIIGILVYILIITSSYFFALMHEEGRVLTQLALTSTLLLCLFVRTYKIERLKKIIKTKGNTMDMAIYGIQNQNNY